MILPINGINFNSQNKAKVNSVKTFANPNIQMKDAVSFGSAQEDASKKVFEIVKEVFAALEDNSDFRGINKELEIFQAKAQKVAERIKNEIFPIVQKRRLNIAENDAYRIDGKTSIIRYQNSSDFIKDIIFDQRDRLKDEIMQKLIINPDREYIEIIAFTKHAQPLEKVAFLDYGRKMSAFEIFQYENSTRDGVINLASSRKKLVN